MTTPSKTPITDRAVKPIQIGGFNSLASVFVVEPADMRALEEAAQGLRLATQQAFWMAESEAERADCIEEMRTSALTWQTRAGKFSEALARFDALKEGK